MNFTKNITIQWRKVWPKGRNNQKRILGNGPELAIKLESFLPDNYLLRLVDTASLTIIEQISIMKKTDYFIGVHGAGLSLSIFMPKQSIFQEILPYKKNKLLLPPGQSMEATIGLYNIRKLLKEYITEDFKNPFPIVEEIKKTDVDLEILSEEYVFDIEIKDARFASYGFLPEEIKNVIREYFDIKTRD